MRADASGSTPVALVVGASPAASAAGTDPAGGDFFAYSGGLREKTDDSQGRAVRMLLDSSAFTAAADGGLEWFARHGAKPDLWIGDADSLGGRAAGARGLLEELEREGGRVIRLPRDKDVADGEAAVLECLARLGEDTLVLFCGALGGRTDHELGNTALAARLHGRLVLLDSLPALSRLLLALGEGDEAVLESAAGMGAALVAWGEGASLGSCSGLLYDPSGVELAPGTRGVSNIVTGRTCRLSVTAGTCILLLWDGTGPAGGACGGTLEIRTVRKAGAVRSSVSLPRPPRRPIRATADSCDT